jgi:heme-degrading monooxygenase HmoA
MFARVTWFQTAADRIDDGVEAFRQQAAPGLSALLGNVGAVLLVDRGTGAGAAVSYWDSLESLQASEDAAVTLRAQTATEGGMTIGDIDRFEVILQERIAPPAANTFVRVNDFQASPDKVNDVVNLVRDTMPTLKAQKGFRAVLVGANRQTGRMFISSVWETAADREASDAAVKERRGQIAQVAGAADVKVDLYESAFAEVKQAARA